MSMGLAEYVTAVLITLVVLANLMHPGGWLLTFLLIAVIGALYVASQFVPEYILTTNQGKNATKQRQRRQRRASGLNPLNWFRPNQGGGRRRGAQRQQAPQQQSRNGGGDRRE